MTVKSILLFLIVGAACTGYGQVTSLGGPKAWSEAYDLKPITNLHVTNEIDLEKVKAEDAVNDVAKDAPWRFGIKHSTTIKIEDDLDAWNVLENGDRIWRTMITCPDAISVNLILENVFIPKGASIYLYDADNTNRVGAYTARNNREDGLLSTELIIGETIVIEYYEPSEVKNQGHFTISSVIHGYRSIDFIQDELSKGINDSGDCHYDVNCPPGMGWEEQARSVAMIVVNGNGICTGALVNNTCEDGRPLLLTANHCLTSGTTTWSFRFNWKSPAGTESCATTTGSTDPGAPYDQTANGATVLANGVEADFLLLEMDNMTLADAIAWNLYYAGWDHNDNTLISEATCIHHPLGDVMKISTEEDAPFHSTVTNANTAVWWINSWEFGTTQGGSSGAPLFDQNGRIVGQLYGGQAGCVGTNNNGSFDYFGRLGVSWDLGVGAHLAPASCGQAFVLDGWDPNSSSQFDNASAQSVKSPLGLICGISFDPEVFLRNAGDNDLTSCMITYNVDGGTDLTYNWTGLLGPNDSELIALPTMTSTDGAHVFNFITSEPNTTTDSNPNNDTVSVSFTLAENTIATIIKVNTDCYGYETSWEVYDSFMTLVAEGGNLSVAPGGNQTASSSDAGSFGNNSLNKEKICLAIGCYDFIIYDDWGDGLEGSSQANCQTDGDYSIINSSSTILGSMQDVAFGTSDTTNFCVVDDLGLGDLSLDDFNLYPNPSSGLVNISLQGAAQSNFELNVRDLSGRVIYSIALQNDFTSVNLQNISSGTYFFSVTEGSTSLTKKVIINN